MTTIKKQMVKAKRLIEAKRLEEARDILLYVDHPTSDKLLARLNKQLKSHPIKVKREATVALNRADMVKAQKLIKMKQYDDARAILITIDHPTAEKWLDRLPAPQAKVANKPLGASITQVGWSITQLGCSIFLLMICGIFFFALLS